MLRVVRLWLPVAIIIVGLIFVAIKPNETGLEGAAMMIGAGLSVALINFLFRLGVTGDRDRDAEAEARAYFDEHGRWPDEA